MNKSWRLLAFLLLFPFTANAFELANTLNKINNISLAQSSQWQSLLHIRDGKPQINDHTFLLSYPNFSAQKELEATLKLLHQQPDIAQCRFPARIHFLRQYLSINSVTPPQYEQCPQLRKYLQWVPFDKIELIYASEVVSSASSMMGHSFIKVSGDNIKGNSVAHSISFFTEFSSFNPVTIMYDSLVSGMNGFFIVRPYSVDKKQYAIKEGRNLWSYTIDITEQEKHLIQLHIWELKDVNIKYYFQNYNCATLTLYILSIAEPQLKKEEKLFVSPLDVVKAAKSHNLVKASNVIMAADWKFNMLTEQIGTNTVNQLNDLVFNGEAFDLSTLDPTSQALSKEYLRLLLNHDSTKLRLDPSYITKLETLYTQTSDQELILDLSRYKNPANSPQDSAVKIQLNLHNQQQRLNFSFLPASHSLMDDNRQYFSESQLMMGEITIEANLHKKRLKLAELTLYSVKSLLPSSQVAPQFSSEFYLGYHQMLNDKLINRGVVDIAFSAGKTKRLHNDIIIYGLLGGGVASTIDDSFFYAAPKVGTLINTIGDGKFKAEYQATYGQFTDQISQSLSLNYAYLGYKDFSFNISVKQTRAQQLKRKDLNLGISFYF